MKKRKILLILVLAFVCLLVVGCNTKEVVEEKPIDESINTPTTIPVEQSDKKEVKMVNDESFYNVISEDGHVTVYYAMFIENPNEDFAVRYPKITMTATDTDGKILTTKEQVIGGIAAGDKFFYIDSFSYEGAEPTGVDISVGNGDQLSDYEEQSSSGIIRADMLIVSNTSENIGSIFSNFTGEVTNNSNEDLSLVKVTVVYMKEEIPIGCDTTFIEDLKSGNKLAFELNAISCINDYDAYFIYASPWM